MALLRPISLFGTLAKCLYTSDSAAETSSARGDAPLSLPSSVRFQGRAEAWRTPSCGVDSIRRSLSNRQTVYDITLDVKADFDSSVRVRS